MGFPMGQRRRTGRRGLAIRFRQLCAFGSYAGRHRLLNDADNVPEPWLHGKQSADGSWLAGSLSFASAAVVLFLIWRGPNPAKPTLTETPTALPIGIQNRQARGKRPDPSGSPLVCAVRT